MAFFQYQRQQHIRASIEQLWGFISSPQNLKQITPPDLGFEFRTTDIPENIYAGMIIRYRVRPLFGVPVDWVSEITHVREKTYFVDEQRAGPFHLWHHQHMIVAVPNGVLMKDVVSYEPPFGLLGRFANTLILRNRFSYIFDYRAKMLDEIFPS